VYLVNQRTLPATLFCAFCFCIPHIQLGKRQKKTARRRKLMMETILYVEDDLSLIDGLEYTLETNGYSVDNARTVKQALALFNSKS